MAALFLLNPPPTRRKRKKPKRKAASRKKSKTSRKRVAKGRSRRKPAARRKPRSSRRGGTKMARKARPRRRRKSAKRRRPNISTAQRRRNALKGIRRRKARMGRRLNKPGLFKRRQRTSKRVRARRVKRGRRKARFSKRGTWRQTLWSHPGPKLAARRRRRRRRNPNGFVGRLMKTDVWIDALQIAGGAVGAGVLAGWAYNRFAPAALQTDNAKMVGRPASIALAGAVIGWGVASFLKNKKLGMKLAQGGLIAAALDVVQQIGSKVGLLGYGRYGDYIQLQGYGTQAQVEAGQFGTQAQVEAGDFGDYIQLQGMGHSEEEVAAAQTFGPTF